MAVFIDYIQYICHKYKRSKMNSKNVFLAFVAAGVIFFTTAYIYKHHIPCETITPHVAAVSFDLDLDQLVAAMTVIGERVPQLSKLSSETVSDCGRMRALFKRTLVYSPDLHIDFIMRTHQDPLGEFVYAKYAHSFGLVRTALLRERYDAVCMEGSIFDGFGSDVRYKEVQARAECVGAKFDPTNIDKANAELDGWLELENRGIRFKAGEDVCLDMIMSEVISGNLSIQGPARERLIDIVQRLRSAYVVAKLIDDLRTSKGHTGAVVFGYLHEKDFRDIASRLGLKARILDTSDEGILSAKG